MRRRRLIIPWLLLFFPLPLLMGLGGAIRLGRDWRTADRSSAGIAPNPLTTPEAVVQVYAARALNWRGIFGVHTWIATKTKNADHYTVHQVIGWRLWHNLATVVSAPNIPDRNWFGNRPRLIAALHGPKATRAIAKVAQAVKAYPYAYEYHLWPGPNSNTFTAYIGRKVPELKLELPVTAIGKDFPINGAVLSQAPSGTGAQISIYGLLGLLMARREGIEINLLGLSFGIDLTKPALKLPFIGRLGFGNTGRSDSGK